MSNKPVNQYEYQMAALETELAPIVAQITALEAELTQLKSDRDQALAKTPILFPCCGLVAPIKDLTYYQTHWYTPPRGCMEGDYWNEGEGQTDCPGCKSRLRLYNRPDLMNLKRLFKNIEKTYDKN